MSTYTVEEYLEAIYHLRIGRKPITTSKLAKKLGISSASASDMIKKLAREGLIKHEPYKGAVLTKKGEKEAVNLVRRHRISERFLTDILGLKWDEVHDEACKFEHVISKDVEDKLDKVLGSPKTCPHGNPIPSAEGKVKEKVTEPLSNFKPREKGIITKITEEKPDLLQYLATLGLLPRTWVEVTEVAPFSGPLLVAVGPSCDSTRPRLSSVEVSSVKSGETGSPISPGGRPAGGKRGKSKGGGLRRGKKRGATYALGRDIAKHIWVEKRGDG